MASTIKQRLRRFNGTGYDYIYLSANVGDVVGTLSVANGGTGASSAADARTKLGVPALSHTHTKSEITDFPSSMPASDVSAWAKASAKPTYTASEVGAAASSHEHATADITSGYLSVAHGGTGRETLTSGYFLRGNGDSAVTMSSAAEARSAMGLGNSTGILGTSYGGTGNSTVDTTPTSGSTKMCTSGGIYTALNDKITYGTSALTPGTSSLTTGRVYLQYE